LKELHGFIFGWQQMQSEAITADMWSSIAKKMAGRETPPSVHNCGYSASREQAMTDFKARWLASI